MADLNNPDGRPNGRDARQGNRSIRLAAAGSLFAVAAVWGLTFVTVKDAIKLIPPYEFLAIRFIIATVALALIFPRQARAAFRPGYLGPVAATGAALALGYATQTVGLKFTSATNAAFITGLSVVFTPLISAILFRKIPRLHSVAAVILSAAGLALLILGPRFELKPGDGLILGTAVAFAIHLVLLGLFAPRLDARSLTIGQLAFSSLCFALTSAFSEQLVVPRGGSVWFAILLTALAASAVAFLVLIWAQSLLSPTTTAIIITMEPVFAAIGGYIFLSERLTPLGWFGAAMIAGAMLIAALRSEPAAT